MINKKLVLASASVLVGAVLLVGAPAAEAHGFLGLGLKGDSDVKIENILPIVRITGSGDVALKGAKVTAVSGGTLNANVDWNGKVASVIVMTDANTKVTVNGSDNAAGSLSNVKVGDTVSIRGTLTAWSATPTFYAKQIVVGNEAAQHPKDTTKKAVLGSVVSVNTAANTFVVTNRKDVQSTVTVNASTTIKTGATSTGSIADIKANEIVGVRGHIDAAGTFIADKIVVGWKGFVGFFHKHF